MKTGSCLCGSVRYEIQSDPMHCNYCCCSICRRLTGSAMGAYGMVRKSEFSWLSGEEVLKTFRQNNNLERFFCSNCGSFLLSVHGLDSVNCYLSLGSLDCHEGIEISYQQFTDSKVPWLELDSSLESHREWPSWIHERISK